MLVTSRLNLVYSLLDEFGESKVNLNNFFQIKRNKALLCQLFPNGCAMRNNYYDDLNSRPFKQDFGKSMSKFEYLDK